MNKLKIVKYLLISFLIAIIILVMLIYIYEKDLFNAYRLLNENKIDVIPEENKKINFNPKTKKGEEIFVEVLYEGLTIDELALKLNKSLKSNLKGTGNLFAKYLSFGLGMQIILQGALNLCVVTSLIPVTGVTLPFFSYGGSSLLVSMISVGIILNICGS